jgi:hypothetical protein
MKTINTYLPVFPGFYSTIFEPDEQFEMDYINELRLEKGLEEVKFDDIEFDYSDYYNQVAKSVTNVVYNELKDFVKDIKFEEVISPKYYNYSNDSINVEITLTKENERKILSYLSENKDYFDKYLKDNYTSRSGFIPYYDNSITEFMLDKPLEHKHKLGSILNFICENEGITQDTLYYGMEAYLTAKNFNELTA